MIEYCLLLSIFGAVAAGPATEGNLKGQYCTDPRTMRRHPAYTEWADAYSCTRHRCQPGGRNLAIYTVGCKRVEAPESAIECEEVVEDTNMQFPYCCTRLRCLVVVRGEVWTRVLGQPWETLPAAPWSHMYKMKKPPPGDNSFLPKDKDMPDFRPGEGPVYELQSEADIHEGDKVPRSKKSSTDAPDYNDVPVARASPVAPDIVIALSTNSKEQIGSNIRKGEVARSSDATQALSFADSKRFRRTPFEQHRLTHKRFRKNNNTPGTGSYFEEDAALEPRMEEPEEIIEKEKPPEPTSDERGYPVTQRPPKQARHQQMAWTEIPQNQWNEHDPPVEAEVQAPREPQQPLFDQPEVLPAVEKKPKGGNLQALVDAIGTRMRDIESVVQRMSDKVHQTKKKPETEFMSNERRSMNNDVLEHKGKPKRPNPDGEHYKRFSKTRGSKYLHGSADASTEPPLFIEDTNNNGYFSDASNDLMRRSIPREPAVATYMAPVDNRRKSLASDENDKKHKKRAHKKKHAKSHHKKHHTKTGDRRRFNKLNSIENEKNTLEDVSGP